MKSTLTIFLLAITILISMDASAQKKKKQTKEDNKSENVLILQSKLDSISYIIGHDIGNNLKTNEITVNLDIFYAGVNNGYSGNDTLISAKATESLMVEFQKEMVAKRDQKTAQVATFEKAKGAAFLQENKSQPGVVELPSGIQYKVINEGTGVNPTPEDVVEVHYTGKLIDGTVFDSSIERGQSVKFPLNRVIPGWTEGLQLMKPGAKYILYIPSSLAYGDKGSGPIPGGATLIFEVELISISKE
ncbi:MAG: FKBP-type peptidyl-prolyl cis-trans isomerase [Lentimicrobiaceae bacterium]